MAFINVAIFTRIANFGFERVGLPPRPRAIAVFMFITFFEFVALVFLIRDFRTALQTLLFYYMPFIVMWLMKDLLEASRKERERTESDRYMSEWVRYDEDEVEKRDD